MKERAAGHMVNKDEYVAFYEDLHAKRPFSQKTLYHGIKQIPAFNVYPAMQKCVEFAREKKRVLDVGTNKGAYLKFIRDINPDALLVGIDVSMNMLIDAEKMVPSAMFVQCFGEEMPFLNNFFDYVICCEVLEHVPDPKLLADTLLRKCSHQIFGTVPAHDNINEDPAHVRYFESNDEVAELFKPHKVEFFDIPDCKYRAFLVTK